MRRRCRSAALYGLLSMSVSGCGTGSGTPVEVGARFELAGIPPVDVRVIVQSEHRRSSDRYLRAAVMSLQTLAPVLGAYPRPSLTLIDPQWGRHPDSGGAAIVLQRTPWWTSPSAMAPELATSRAVARRYLLDVFDVSALPAWFVDGLVEYMARRAVAPIFQGVNLERGYAMLEQRYFGGFV